MCGVNRQVFVRPEQIYNVLHLASLLEVMWGHQVVFKVKDLCKHELIEVACALLPMWECTEAGGGKSFVTFLILYVSCQLCHLTGLGVHPLHSYIFLSLFLHHVG